MTISTAFPPQRKARGVALAVRHENLGSAGTKYKPARICILGQGKDGVSYTTDRRQVFSAAEVGQAYGFISPLYIAAKSIFDPAVGVGDIPVICLPLAQPVSDGVNATGTITPTITSSITKTATYKAKIANLESQDIVLVAGDNLAAVNAKIVAAINAVRGMPVTASTNDTLTTLTVGWEGATGTGIAIEIESPDDAEVTFVTADTNNGAGTVLVETGLAELSSDWDNIIVNCLGTGSGDLNAISEAGETRWGAEVKKPFVAISGHNGSYATVTAITDGRKTDRVNVIVANPGDDLPLLIAAEAAREIAKLSNVNPAHDYGSRKLKNLTPPEPADEWSSSQRQGAILAGCSTTQVKDGVVCLSDVVTCYHPTGEEPPGYEYVCDLMKVMTMMYNVNAIFESADWDGAPLVPDDQTVKNPSAKKPKIAKSQVFQVLDNAADDAIISDVEFAKTNTLVEISSVNPKRLDVKVVFKVSGNANVISIDMVFGFYYGGE